MIKQRFAEAMALLRERGFGDVASRLEREPYHLAAKRIRRAIQVWRDADAERYEHTAGRLRRQEVRHAILTEGIQLERSRNLRFWNARNSDGEKFEA